MKLSNLQKGLINHWMFDAAHGIKALVPNGVDGVAQGGVTIGGAADRKSKASSATTMITNDYVDFNNLYNNTTYKTASCWVRLNAQNQTAAILGNLRSGYLDDVAYSYGKGIYVQGRLLYLFGAANHNTTALTVSFDDTSWHHVVGVWNGASSILYVDGISAATGTLNDGWNYYFGIGASIQYGLNYYLNGDIADVRLYNRVLTPAEITLLKQSYFT